MKFKYLLLQLIQCKETNSIIKNINTPACRNCIYYQPIISSDDFTSSLNKCKKFGSKDIITDEIKYDYADFCRKDENKCGIEGKYFIEEKNINLKILKHKLVSSLPGFFIVTLLTTYILVIYLSTNLPYK
jgi:hypothetical protein